MTICASLNRSSTTSVSRSWSDSSPWPSRPEPPSPQLHTQPAIVSTSV
eukprot:CAMPEP_0179447132 /NCGR_PEP_ID=MMETSP0799-20121207/30897_1 /TAXON_ID=46947 /ORGANISM="Geminigera cryophila, Strain CCMP2564" /LENGTH=47 /DNA_ID= /DNA_START= /DNA_END= /DNA_ORIENTATION=